jgi:hypothetical protein
MYFGSSAGAAQLLKISTTHIKLRKRAMPAGELGQIVNRLGEFHNCQPAGQVRTMAHLSSNQ